MVDVRHAHTVDRGVETPQNFVLGVLKELGCVFVNVKLFVKITLVKHEDQAGGGGAVDLVDGIGT